MYLQTLSNSNQAPTSYILITESFSRPPQQGDGTGAAVRQDHFRLPDVQDEQAVPHALQQRRASGSGDRVRDVGEAERATLQRRHYPRRPVRQLARPQPRGGFRLTRARANSRVNVRQYHFHSNLNR